MFRSKGHLLLQDMEEAREKQTIIYELLQNTNLDIDGVRDEFLALFPDDESLFNELIDEAVDS